MTQTTASRIKCAVIREEGYPIGQPAPCYIKCECGTKVRVTPRVLMHCDVCGRIYDDRGWLVDDLTGAR